MPLSENADKYGKRTKDTQHSQPGPRLGAGKGMQHEIVKGLTENKIHIAAIQEAHINQDRNYMMGNYRIITSAAGKSAETGVVAGGTAIMVHESLQQHITQIT